MNLNKRRILYSFFIFLFFLIAPLLILYSLGYRYDFVKGSLEKIGVLFIKSYPKSANIFLNNKLQANKTPTQIVNLISNTYDVRIEKEGYHTWQKNLEVRPQETTFAEEVTLFKNNLEYINLLEGEYINILASLNYEKVALIKKDNLNEKLEIYKISENKSKEIFTGNKLELIKCTQTNQKLIIKNNYDYLIINSETNNVISLFELTGYYFDELKPDYFNDNIYYGLNNNRLYKIDLLENKVTQISKEFILAFESWKTKLLYITSINNKYILKTYLNNESTELLVLPNSKNYKFIPSDKNLIALLDLDENILYLLEPDNNEQPFKNYIKNVNNLDWHNDYLVYYNNSEIWTYFPEHNHAILLERTVNNLTNAFWHPGLVNVFGIIDNTLKIYELDSRDRRNIFDLLNLTNDNLFIDKKGDKLYLLTEHNNQKGFFKIEIQ